MFYIDDLITRYLDAKYSRWLGADPSLNDYILVAPIDNGAKKHNSNLHGQGGIFNLVNLQLYHYAGNNPIKYVDTDGRIGELAIPFGWLPFVDGPFPIGDMIYAGLLLFEFYLYQQENPVDIQKDVPAFSKKQKQETDQAADYEWDYQHGDVEKYNKRGKHQGTINPETGKQTKPPVKGREVEP